MPIIHDNHYKCCIGCPNRHTAYSDRCIDYMDRQGNQRCGTAAVARTVRTHPAQSNKRQKITERRSAHAEKEKAAPPMFRLYIFLRL